jgi:hypothetical protein
MILRLLLSAPSMGILLPPEHLHSFSLTVNIISPYIFVKHSKHSRHWLQYCYHAICTQWYSALLKSESLKFHFLFSHCSALHSVTVHILSRCLFSSFSKRQWEVKKLAKCIWNGSFSCHVSTLMYSSTRAAPKSHSLYAMLTLAFSP